MTDYSRLGFIPHEFGWQDPKTGWVFTEELLDYEVYNYKTNPTAFVLPNKTREYYWSSTSDRHPGMKISHSMIEDDFYGDAHNGETSMPTGKKSSKARPNRRRNAGPKTATARAGGGASGLVGAPGLQGADTLANRGTGVGGDADTSPMAREIANEMERRFRVSDSTAYPVRKSTETLYSDGSTEVNIYTRPRKQFER